MSQCVPTWNSDQHPSIANVPSSVHHLFSGSVSENLKSNNEVAELRWKNGKPQLGTLESIIDQATAGNSGAVHQPSFVSWLTGVDATVHCSDVPNLASRAGSCSGDGEVRERKRARRWSSVNEEEEEEDTCDLYGTTSSPEGVWEEGGGSPETENTSSGDHEYSLMPQSRRSLRVGRVRADQEKEKKKMKKKKVMGRSRAADIHNQSERKRRDKINQKMRTLQKLVPNSTKTDKASILDEVIDYLKQLQNQVKSMGSFPQMMMPLAMPHLQMAQMAQMAQMGLGHGFMDLGFFGRPGAMATPLPPLHHPPAFMPFVAAGERMPTTGGNSVSPDAFFPFSQQSMNMDAYNKMIAMYQQLHQQPPKPNI